jgi:glycosyltransferase involved in cell wall biosynthesis
MSLVYRVRYSSWGPRFDVADLLPAFDVFVSSSRWEGLPRVVVEAMAAGVPVAATDAGGIREVVVDELSGLLVPVGDGDALGKAIERLLDDRRFARGLARGATTRIAGFDVSEMISQLEGLYRELSAGKRA